MATRMREHDWSSSSLGEPDNWPQPLRTATGMMLNTVQPMFIAWGGDLAFIYNDAYAPFLGARHPAALGRRFRDVWSDIWGDLIDFVDAALEGRSVWLEDLPLLMTRHGYPEQTYFTFTYSPLHDESGRVGGMFCACIETTARVNAEQRLREAAAALAESEERYRLQGERLSALFEKAPGFVAVLEGPDHVYTLVNSAYRQLIGHRDVVGMTARKAHPNSPSRVALLDQVYATGEPLANAGLRAPIQRTPGGEPDECYLDFIYQPIRDETGRVAGIFLQGTDVTERELYLEKQQLLLNELNHRVKNNLATVQSMAAQTARRSLDVGAFVRDFEGRLVALAGTHDVLTQNAWAGADLRDVLNRELSVFTDRVTLDGPPLQLSAPQVLAFGLIAHELATNAAKYGALTTGSGRVRVRWRVDRPAGRFVLEWLERGGPKVSAPGPSGFGSRLIANLAGGDLGGRLDIDYAPEGLRLVLDAPIEPHGKGLPIGMAGVGTYPRSVT